MQGNKAFIRNRIIAFFIDFTIIMLLCKLAFIIFGVPDWGRYLATQSSITGLTVTDPLVIERMRLYQESFIWTLVIGMTYEALMLLIFQGTIGKLLFGLHVLPMKEDTSSAKAKLALIIRALIKALSLYLLSAIPFLFMCLTTFGNAEKRSGFDVFARTKVVRKY
ncbi:MAG: RDD family protein [Deferribacteraceae bacterium]|jgi:uncharacterized RDD family membrane protein YckC|nr:RDD family protein [Deferribacteraceae bacterium]